MLRRSSGDRSIVAMGVAAIMFVCVIVVFFGLAITDNMSPENATIVRQLITVVGLAIPVLLGVARIEKSAKVTSQLRDDLHNGLVADKVTEALSTPEAKSSIQESVAEITQDLPIQYEKAREAIRQSVVASLTQKDNSNG